MGIKTVNDITSPNGLVPILLVFETYWEINVMDLLLPNILQRAAAIDKAINKLQKIWAENQIADTLNARNGLLVDLVQDLLLNSDVLI